MTHRELPAKPDIQHLRKEAKGLYRRLKRQAPEAKLADAQFILAAEYGFKSWSKLKSQIDRHAEKRWAARLAEQESFRPYAAQNLARPSMQKLWLRRQDALTEEDDTQTMSLEFAGVQIGFILLALIVALIIAAH
jgi:hypothetical protein